MSFWQGPYTIKSRMSDVLYSVDCGRSNSVQIVHVERMRRLKRQTLTGEEPIDERPLQTRDILPNDDRCISESEEDTQTIPETNNTNRFGRQIKKPSYLKDFVSSIFRMAKTKVTERKVPTPLICPLCKTSIPQRENFAKHVADCTESRFSCQ